VKMKRFMMLLALVNLLGLSLNAADTTRGPLGFESYDTNKDGVITKDEFDAVKKDRMDAKEDAGMPMRNAVNSPDFDYFDTNKDGKITKEELQAGQLKRMQDNRQGRGMQ